jgi:hypothetical protein
LAENVVVSTSCSLLHSAVDLKNETKLDAELKSWLAFAAQKLLEVVALASAAAGKKDEVMQTCSICFLLFPKACSSKEKGTSNGKLNLSVEEKRLLFKSFVQIRAEVSFLLNLENDYLKSFSILSG